MSNLLSTQCVDFVKSFEGFRSTPYLDPVGVKTLGYGMTGAAIAGLSSVTEKQASDMLKTLMNNNYAQPLKNSLDSKGVTLNQNQFDALVSMAYNIGIGGLLGSTLYRNVCSGVRDVDTITANFCSWCHAGEQVLAGLLRRRQAEAKMFFGSGNKIQGVTVMPKIAILKFTTEDDWSAKDIDAKLGGVATYVRQGPNKIIPAEAMGAEQLIVVGGAHTGHPNEVYLSGNTKYDTVELVSKWLNS